MNVAFSLKNKYAVLVFVLVLIVISACSKEEGFAVYNIEGTVTESTGLIPLKKIRMIRQSTDYLFSPDTTYTDSLGRYSFNFTDYYKKNYSIDIAAEDFDGNLNKGSYLRQTIHLTFTPSDWSFTSNDKALRGEATKSLNFKMNLEN
jgi:hypothetical protein